MSFTLKDIVPWGRSFDEYVAMFNLTEDDLKGRILGCGDGPASFNAEGTKKDMSIVSVDPIYQFSIDQIQIRIQEVKQEIVQQLYDNQDDYLWEHFTGPDDLIAQRLSTMDRFLLDFEIGIQENRYITASLPQLPFEEQQFDLALVSHLLFTYSEHLDFSFHKESILELLRVAGEVRIFPLCQLGGKQSSLLQPLLDFLDVEEYKAEIVPVLYRFQKGGESVLCVKRLGGEWIH